MTAFPRSFRVFIIVFFVFLPVCSGLHATVTLPSFFSDNMVLQQKTAAAVWGWATPGATVVIIGSWDKTKYSVKTDASGKWKAKINTPAAGGPYQVSISDGKPITLHNVLIGEVWFCSGQSNMEMPMKGFRDQPVTGSNDAIFSSANDQLRLYTVPRSVQKEKQDTSKTSSWKTATPENVSNFSATAYYFGRLLQQTLHVPVALINDSYGGSPAEAFMSRESLVAFPAIPVHAPASSEKLSNKNATTIYNGMIHPVIGYTIKGCIWYQGESNNGRPDEYAKLFPAMVSLWRNEWGQGDFPFYYAQIAPYNYSSYSTGADRAEKMNSAYLRDAQRIALSSIPFSGMVVLMDNGEETNIHPADKETAGKRFAYLALGDTYQLKGFGYQSPVFDSMSVSGSIATIRFRYAPNGLTSYGKPLTQFEIAGSDKIFRPAKATIVRGTVLISSPDVPNPVAVRYAFRDFVAGELFNTEGLPVSSFRTDGW